MDVEHWHGTNVLLLPLHVNIQWLIQNFPHQLIKLNLSHLPCYFCGNQHHQRRNCPAREVTCNNCGVKGHFAKVCLSKKKQNSVGTTATLYSPTICAMGMLAIFPPGLSHAAVTVTINGHELTALIDSCSSDSFISEDSVKQLGLEIQPSSRTISMALTTMNTSITGCCTITLTLGDNVYNGIRLSVLKDLCSDIILGHNFQKLHKSLTIDMGGTKPDLIISNTSPCALSTATIDNISLFTNLLPECKPIATKSRRFSFDDEDFIQGEIDRLLSGGIIEPSSSPWRAQIVVVKNGTQSVKKRLCVDYSQIINLYTELDAYPLPRIDTMINKLAQYKVFSTYDLKNAYHQIPISQAERKYTAFEAGGQLYQFCRIPFGVTNGVAVFQRLMDKIIKEEELKDTFPYLDDITVAGRTQEEHDSNVKAFLEVVKRRHLTLNHSKSVLSALSITVLGYLVEHGSIKPDPDRLHLLQNLPPPTSVRSLRRAMGMFAYYAKWIPDFSDKITAPTNANVFLLSPTPLAAFNTLKKELERASLNPIDESLPFVVGCDASEVAVSATLPIVVEALHGSHVFCLSSHVIRNLNWKYTLLKFHILQIF